MKQWMIPYGACLWFIGITLVCWALGALWPTVVGIIVSGIMLAASIIRYRNQFDL